jgi:uncharacterized protein YggE
MCGDFLRTIFFVLACVLIVYGIFYVDSLTNYQNKKLYYVGKADQMERTINVTGMGKETGKNDIAITTIGYSNVDKNVLVAKTANAKVMDQVMNDLKKMGINEKDLMTNYTIYPEYNYTNNEGQVLKGYRVTNSITVKIRNLEQIEKVLSLAGTYGANEISGLNFTIDDPENLKDKARAKALVDARVKAEQLAKSLGVRLGAVVTFNEYGDSNDYDYAASNVMRLSDGMGGGGAPESVASGSQDVVSNVNVTYEILPQ